MKNSLQSFGRSARLKTLASSPLVKLLGETRSPEKRQEILSNLLATLRSGDIDASPLASVPAVGTPLEYILKDYQNSSSIPLGIPFWTIFTLTAQFLVQRGAAACLPDGSRVLPTLYTLILADSGEAKTWNMNVLGQAFTDLFSGAFPFKLNKLDFPKSAEGLLQQLVEMGDKPSLLQVDEFGRAWRRWTQDPAQSMIGDVLLMAYTQEEIRQRLKNSEYQIPKPILSVLAYTQLQLFRNHFSEEDWLSGLLQRFTIAPCPPRDGWQDSLELYPLKVQLGKISLPMLRDLIRSTEVQNEYTLDDSALKYAAHHVSRLAKTLHVTKGFALRALYNSYKFAVIFHFLHGRSTPVIDRTDMEYAIRLVEIALSDLRFMMDETERSDLAVTIDKSLKCYRKLQVGGYKGSPKWSRSFLAQHVDVGRQMDLVWELVDFELEQEAAAAKAAAKCTIVAPIALPASITPSSAPDAARMAPIVTVHVVDGVASKKPPTGVLKAQPGPVWVNAESVSPEVEAMIRKFRETPCPF